MRLKRAHLVVLIALAGASAATTAAALTGEDDASTAQAGPVSAFPAPGTRFAQRGTEISLRGLAPDQVGAVTVTGSRSGEHQGTLEAHPDGRGASFVPSGEFRPGERVTVRTDLDVRGAENGDFRFTILRGEFETGTSGSDRSIPRPRRGTYHAYRSDPIKTPRLVVDRRRSGRAPGYLVVNTGWDDARPRPEGVLIADDNGRPVYFGQRTAQQKFFDVAVQEYKGQPVLTFWRGRFAAGWGYGEYVMLDQSYREIKLVRARSGYRADIHDMQITPEGTALVQAYNRVRYDLRRYGGRRNGEVLDNVIQEIDLDTGRLLFEWHSLGNIGLRESHDRPADDGSPFDYFHLNSMEVGPDGDLIISARNSCAVYEIDRTTGAVNWRLGGKRSDFRLGRGVRFCRQHDARWVGDERISIFDNHVDGTKDRGQSRGILLAVDERRERVRLVQAYRHPGRHKVANKGGMRAQPNGNSLVGWGAVPRITEYTRGGRIVFDAHFKGATDGSYRALRASWVGRPATPPKVAAQQRGGRVAVWASWNGATEVARWEVLAGESPDALASVGGRARTAFETAISVEGRHAFVAVRALDSAGNVLGTSAAERVSGS
jgi:hypothetical protein